MEVEDARGREGKHFSIEGVANPHYSQSSPNKAKLTRARVKRAERMVQLKRFSPNISPWEDHTPARQLGGAWWQTTSVQEYQSRFENLGSMVDWTPKSLIAAFIGGLKEEIQIDIRAERNTELVKYFAKARSIEERQQQENSNVEEEEDPPPKIEEIHESEPKDEPEPEPNSDSVCNMMADPNRPNTMKVPGRIGSTHVLVLIDSGATHNFVGDHVADDLDGSQVEHPTLRVLVANGASLPYTRRCTNVELTLQKVPIKVDLLVVPLSKLETLGMISWDFAKMTMSFLKEGGDGQVTLKAVNLRKDEHAMRYLSNGKALMEELQGSYLKRLNSNFPQELGDKLHLRRVDLIRSILQVCREWPRMWTRAAIEGGANPHYSQSRPDKAKLTRARVKRVVQIKRFSPNLTSKAEPRPSLTYLPRSHLSSPKPQGSLLGGLNPSPQGSPRVPLPQPLFLRPVGLVVATSGRRCHYSGDPPVQVPTSHHFIRRGPMELLACFHIRPSSTVMLHYLSVESHLVVNGYSFAKLALETHGRLSLLSLFVLARPWPSLRIEGDLEGRHGRRCRTLVDAGLDPTRPTIAWK
ncbi:hypothetical protein EJ110_NYTH09817 [Nymphaea thermarum]|nr:hypothetical protein EJ110_NYTH09817 [Nymphaea thermarum]